MSGGYRLGISVESWQLDFWSELPAAALGRYPIALAEVPSFELLRLRRSRHVGTSIAEFLNSPYALIVDVRMLNFFRYIGGTAAWVVLGLVIASLFVQNFWCRYLCPYGGFLGLASLLSPMRITRNPITCIDCAKCGRRVPRHCRS